LFVRAASGRQRFDVLGAWNAVTRQLVSVTNTTVVNTETMCELMRKIAALKLVGPVTLVLDNAKCQRNAAVYVLAKELGIRLMFLPTHLSSISLNGSGILRSVELCMAATTVRLLNLSLRLKKRLTVFQTYTLMI
jgi:hypothetical protein